MDVTLVGLLGVGLLLTLLAIGVPIAFAMAFTGALGLWMLEGASSTMALIALVPWEHGRSFVFVTVPLFVLMGQLFFHTGLASDLYEGLRKWIGRVPGGMAIASVLACGAFGAVTGSSIATVATMGSIVMPEMRRYGYDPRLATVALVTPPVGANVFVMRRVAPEVPMREIFLGVFPFVVGELVVLAILIAFPALALWLPEQMK